MNKRKKALEIILRQHISTYDDNAIEELEYLKKNLWFNNKVKLRQWFGKWYEQNNIGRWEN